MKQKIKDLFQQFKLELVSINFLQYLTEWGIVSIITAALVGSGCALFLWGLEEVTELRTSNEWLLWLLPFGAWLTGYLYSKYGKEEGRGNDLIFDAFHQKEKTIPWKLGPFVLVATWVSHLFGASVGREGTAVQLGTAISTNLSQLAIWKDFDRKTLLLMGISSGFAAVFGTPIAGMVFAFELFLFKRWNLKNLYPVILVAFLADFVCDWWGIQHTVYIIKNIPAWSPLTFIWTLLAGLIFGFGAVIFIHFTHFIKSLAKLIALNVPMKMALAGLVFTVIIVVFGGHDFCGLGIPTIQNAFKEQFSFSTPLIKLLLTAFAIGFGFKGGEVTPLFFIGATLGSALSVLLGLPLELLAEMGFVAVFAGATKTPFAAAIMGVELFGGISFPYLLLACFVAYYFSGKSSIYSAKPELEFL